MSNIGDTERETQNRVVQFFIEKLSYNYLGNRARREENSNIETELLETFLKKQGNRYNYFWYCLPYYDN